MSPLANALVTFCAALGSGVVAGVFFAFSTFVMPALARLPAGNGVAAMQAINAAAINRWFMGALFGTAAACLVVAGSALLDLSGTAARLRLGGSVLYLAGAIFVTVAFNVPRNEALAAVAPGDATAADLWARYVVEWTRWNHLRTAAAFSAAVILSASLGLRHAPPP
jgi:uncharacterized membrane protein